MGEDLGVGVGGEDVAVARASSAASSRQFSMMPLCTTATRPVQSRMGMGVVSVGWPWVAHRVWPIPADTASGAVLHHLAQVGSSERVPVAARARQSSPSDCRATPAES